MVDHINPTKEVNNVIRLSTLQPFCLAPSPCPPLADEVNVYSHRQPELIQPLADAFTAETGIDVNIAFVDKGMAERLIAEGDRSPADLVLTVDIARLTQIVDAGVTQPVDSAVLAANIPANPARSGQPMVWSDLPRAHRLCLKGPRRRGEVTTYEDLASDKWNGRICSRSGTNDYNVALLGAVIAHHDEKPMPKLGRRTEGQSGPQTCRR